MAWMDSGPDNPTRGVGERAEKEDTVKLFVGGLAWATDDKSLRAAFQPFGNLQDAVVIMDRDTGRSRGFGFVTYSDDASGQAALQAMNGATLDGRSIRCDAAVERERGSGPGPRPGGMDRPPPRDDAPRFGGGGGGGFAGGGGGGGGFAGGGGGGFQGGGGGGGAPPRGRSGPPDRGRGGGGPGPGRGGGGPPASEWGTGPRGGKRRGGGNRRQDDDFGDD
jgi:cold-inducible RNA-binding protein